MLDETKKMSCSDCDRYEIGCEETCPYEIEDERTRESLFQKREAMKAEADLKGIQKCRERRERSKIESNMEKQLLRRERRMKKNKK